MDGICDKKASQEWERITSLKRRTSQGSILTLFAVEPSVARGDHSIFLPTNCKGKKFHMERLPGGIAGHIRLVENKMGKTRCSASTKALG